MKKYLTVFTIAWQNEFIYRFNFVLWRLRNILRFLMTFFLWSGVFMVNKQALGYSKPEMLTYVFISLIVATLVVSAPSADNIGGEIANGDLSNYLIKPVSYLKYWFIRDLSSKLLNIIFALLEVSILWFILHPTVQLPENLLIFMAFLLSCALAVTIYFFVSTVTRFVAFWAPENTWGISFVIAVMLEILSGVMFPLDILPRVGYLFVQFTPFPYLLYFPVKIFLGKIEGVELLRIILQSSIWVLIMYFLIRFFWKKGLVIYGSEGR